MKTVVLGEPPIELAELLERRRKLGLDTHDEVWDGEYHMTPYAHTNHGIVQAQVARIIEPLASDAGMVATVGFNLGEATNFRVPDGGVHRGVPGTLYVPSAAVVVEVISPDDESYAKLPFYAASAVDEVWMVDPATRTVRIFVLRDSEYAESGRSDVLDVESSTVEDSIN